MRVITAVEDYKRLNEKYVMEDAYITIGNNDTPIWCQCENCKTFASTTYF